MDYIFKLLLIGYLVGGLLYIKLDRNEGNKIEDYNVEDWFGLCFGAIFFPILIFIAFITFVFPVLTRER